MQRRVLKLSVWNFLSVRRSVIAANDGNLSVQCAVLPASGRRGCSLLLI